VDNFYQYVQSTDYIPLPGFYSQLDGGSGFDTVSANFALENEAVVWTSATPTNIEFRDGQYARNFEQISSLVTGAGGDNITQLGRVDNYYIHLGAGNDAVNPGLGKDNVDGGLGNDLIILDFSVNDNGEAITGSTYGGFHRGNGGLDRVSLTAFERCRVTGTAQNDTILGGLDVNSTVFGGAGNDSIDSYSGSNYFDGGAGNDTLYGSRGGNGTGVADDTLIGGTGNDLLDSRGYGADSLLGGDGNDTLTLGGNTYYLSDFADGGAGNDEVYDYGFNSSYFGGANANTVGSMLRLDGGIGSDTLSADFSNQTQAISFNQAAPTGTTFADGAYFRNFEFLKNFASGAGNDAILLSGRADNEIAVTNGNDTVNPGLGLDNAQGGNGTDLLIVDYSADDAAGLGGVLSYSGYLQRVNTATNTIVDRLTHTGFENFRLTGGSKADSLIGGYAQDDTLTGNGGDDTLDGYNGNDRLIGGDGNDVLIFGSAGAYGKDFADAGAGNDSVTSGSVYLYASYTPVGSALALDGGAGIDTLSADYGNQTKAVLFNQASPTATTFAADAYFRNFEVIGNLGTGSGNDRLLLTGRANNTLHLGAGNDTVNPGLGLDNVNGADGTDMLILDYSQGQAANIGAVTLTGTTAYRRDTATNANVDSIGFLGFEKLQITGSNLADNLNAASITGPVVFNGGAGNDSITGGTSADAVTGSSGDDILSGTSYNGAAEIDTLTGGTGNDVFILGTASVRLYDDNATGSGTQGYALITDFTAGDKLQLRGTVGQYFLGTSPAGLPVGSAIFHDSNASGSLNSTDELIAIVQGPAAATALASPSLV